MCKNYDWVCPYCLTNGTNKSFTSRKKTLSIVKIIHTVNKKKSKLTLIYKAYKHKVKKIVYYTVDQMNSLTTHYKKRR